VNQTATKFAIAAAAIGVLVAGQALAGRANVAAAKSAHREEVRAEADTVAAKASIRDRIVIDDRAEANQDPGLPQTELPPGARKELLNDLGDGRSNGRVYDSSGKLIGTYGEGPGYFEWTPNPPSPYGSMFGVPTPVVIVGGAVFAGGVVIATDDEAESN
jgi:hypothetical protein